nr:MAG TPA: hypothetical protein [Caudoviricetes sp.]
MGSKKCPAQCCSIERGGWDNYFGVTVDALLKSSDGQ